MAPKEPNQVGQPRRARLAVAAIALITCLLTPAAEAKIVVDPEGPAGKQYSALLDRAREEASGRDGTAGVPGSTAKAPLFGEGIESGRTSRGEGDSGGGRSVAPPDSLGATDEGGATLRLAAISLGVLALGALLAFAGRFGGRRLSS